MPFENVKVSDSYYIVPTSNPSWRRTVDQKEPRIGLTVEKIVNPTSAPRPPVATAALPMDETWTYIDKNPNDKNTAGRLTEKEQMVLYPHQSRYGK